MGSGPSVAGDTPGADLRLPGSGLRFSLNQLRALNSYVDTLYEEDQKGRLSTETECAVENLVQRIVDGAGQRDPRFRCCHIIALHRGKRMRSRSLEYLVTLDALPALNGHGDCALQDGPAGYGRIRLTGREADRWAEFLTPAGYLCRDKIVERWVELVARCAQARGGGASRAVCARAAARAAPGTYCYLEKVNPQSSPERRLAIVEGASWVMVRVGSGAGGEAEAKLVLGARVVGCSAAAYTCRVPVTHPLALLHYTSAGESYYAAAVGPPSSTACTERAATWQLWHPALEAALDAHCSDLSTVARIAGALNALIDKMREGCYQGSLRMVSRYLASCALRRRLDRLAVHRAAAARCCVAAHAAHHLLLVLDDLLCCCEHGDSAAGYVYGSGRAALARRGARTDHWLADAHCLRSCLLVLHRVTGTEEIPATPSEQLETALFARWESLNRESKAAAGAAGYSKRQLRYLWRVASELVNCKRMVVYDHQSMFRVSLAQQERLEELVHILAILLDQARDLYLHQRTAPGEFDRELAVYRSKKWNKLKDYYDASSACLIDAVRRDPELRREDLTDETCLMRNILSWLHRGAKDDRKYLGPVLKPFLEALFTTSLENAWFLEDFDARKCENEFEGLREYCAGVHEGSVEPCEGLLVAAKQFAWAKAMVDLVDRYRHVEFRLVFPTGDGLAVSFPARLAGAGAGTATAAGGARLLTLSRRDKDAAKLRLARRCLLGAFHSALRGTRPNIARHESTEEILASAKNGNYWRNSTKPDIIPSSSVQDIPSSLDMPRVRRRSRRSRPATSYGFPEISVTSQSDSKTIRRKYHTLKSLVYPEPVENIRELRRRPRSAGSTVRNKEPLSRPTILETLDFINSVKDALCVEESGASDAEDTSWSAAEQWLVSATAPLALLAARCGGAPHLALGDLVRALLTRGKFTILQSLCSYLGPSNEGALFALHRLARAARARSSERDHAWKLPEATDSEKEAPQRYRARGDCTSGDEAPPQSLKTTPAPPPQPARPPQPPPLPRRTTAPLSSHEYMPSKRLQELELHLSHLERVKSRLTLNQTLNPLNGPTPCTGIINPLYDVKIPKDKFMVKRTKSLGRSFSSRALEVSRYNLTLGGKTGVGQRGKTNDVVTAMADTTGETGLDLKNNFLHRYRTDAVVGDSYRISRPTID